MRRHYEELGRNLRKTLVYRSGVSPLGLLRNCLDHALNDSTRIDGVFESVKSVMKFPGSRDLLDDVTFLNDFRNRYVAHQEEPLQDKGITRKALCRWIETWIETLTKMQIGVGQVGIRSHKIPLLG